MLKETTGHVFDVESENFTLRNILEAPLLQYKEEIEVKNMCSYFMEILFIYNATLTKNCVNLKKAFSLL